LSTGEPQKTEESKEQSKSKIYVLTIQILFGIIIGISFTDYHKELVPFNPSFETIMIFVAYATVLLSLVGYSITVKFRYHKKIWRFILDIILLYLYYQLVYSPRTGFDYFLWIFPAIFFIYVIWQILEYGEWRNEENHKYKLKPFLITVVVTIAFTIAFGLIAYLYQGEAALQNSTETGVIKYLSVTNLEWIILGIIVSLQFVFRIFISLIESKWG